MHAGSDSIPDSAAFGASIVTGISDKTISELRILRACVKLLRVPEGITQALVSLARIGNFEIRMFRDHHAISGADHCSGWSCSITARAPRSIVSVATRSKTR